MQAKSATLALMLTLPCAAEESSDLAFFLFIADYTDENGQWNAPQLLPDVNQADNVEQNQQEKPDE